MCSADRITPIQMLKAAVGAELIFSAAEPSSGALRWTKPWMHVEYHTIVYWMPRGPSTNSNLVKLHCPWNISRLEYRVDSMTPDFPSTRCDQTKVQFYRTRKTCVLKEPLCPLTLVLTAARKPVTRLPRGECSDQH